MFLFPQLTSQLISLVAIGVYLGAAFLPCEPTSEERSALATALSGGTAHSAAAPRTPLKHRTPAMPERLQGDGVDHHARHSDGGNAAAPSGHDHATHDRSNLDRSSHDHAARGHAGHGEAEARSAQGKRVHLALKAKCVCGCDRTRSQVGGGAARLGSVVLAAIVTGLEPAPVVVPEDRVLARWVEVHFEDDLVPI